MRLNFQLSHPCEMDSGGSYVHGDTDFVSIIPARKSWVLISNSMLNIFSHFNHPNPRGLGRASLRNHIEEITCFNHPNP